MAKIARKLRPPGCFEPKILTGDDCTTIGQVRARLCEIVIELLHRGRKDCQRQMMLA
ncbi:hypothetical protein D3C87_2124340 [compost metagenome]